MELNPFNILNVYADCSAKELAASKARLTAFTSVGKVVKDLVVSASEKKQHNVTTVQIQAAYNTLQQPSNKISYALLWFFKPEVDDLRELLEHGTVSEIACGFENYYDRLDDESPKPLWLLQDLTIINLLSENCVKALTFAYEIFSRTQEWLDSIGCETSRMSSQELEMLFIALLEETGYRIEKNQLYLSLIERCLKELTGNSFELHVLSKKVLLLEKNYSYVETYTEKAQMETYHSSNMDADYLSEELSAEVLKRLKSYVGDGTAVNEAVVTVPAKFTVNQKTATMKAAELAGITHCELIQEPIAAAIAYGFNAESKDGYWLVFDFGGGTFDAALIRSDEGVIQVFDTEGDNYLGGKNMDYAIVDTLLVPYLQKEYALDATIADERKHQVLREAMKAFAEEIKNSVSFNDKIDILSNLGELGCDEDGEEMELDLTLSRNDVFACMAPLAQKAIDICLALLERNNLSGKNLHSILLVGGPTYSPLIREMLKERLGAMVDTSINPMTAVSVGAALYASTIKSETGDVEKQNEEALRLDMEYESTSVEASEWIAVKCGQLVNEGNIKVQFIKEDGSWESESIEVDTIGNVVEVQLDNGANVFRVKASDMKGNPISVQPNSISIMQGAKVGSAPLPYYIGISAWDSRYEKSVFMPLSGLEKNQLLPAEGYLLTEKTMNDIHPGNEEDKIIIPVYQADEFVEGNSSVLYEYVADVELSGLEIDRYIPANSSVEVKLSVDTSEMMDMEIHFPDLDLTINKHLDTSRHQSVTEASERVQRDLRLAEKSLGYLQSKGVDTRDEFRMLNTVEMEDECSQEKKWYFSI